LQSCPNFPALQGQYAFRIEFSKMKSTSRELPELLRVLMVIFMFPFLFKPDNIASWPRKATSGQSCPDVTANVREIQWIDQLPPSSGQKDGRSGRLFWTHVCVRRRLFHRPEKEQFQLMCNIGKTVRSRPSACHCSANLISNQDSHRIQAFRPSLQKPPMLQAAPLPSSRTCCNDRNTPTRHPFRPSPTKL